MYKSGSAILYTDKLKVKEKKSKSSKKRSTKKSPSSKHWTDITIWLDFFINFILVSSRTESESDEPITPRDGPGSMKSSRRDVRVILPNLSFPLFSQQLRRTPTCKIVLLG
jgi:hypothetical protein